MGAKAAELAEAVAKAAECYKYSKNQKKECEANPACIWANLWEKRKKLDHPNWGGLQRTLCWKATDDAPQSYIELSNIELHQNMKETALTQGECNTDSAVSAAESKKKSCLAKAAAKA